MTRLEVTALWLFCALVVLVRPAHADGGIDAGRGDGGPATPVHRVTVPASRDATLYDEDSDLSNGEGAYFFVGVTGQGARRRGLVAFDVASFLPPGTMITRATLRISVSRTASDPATVSVHRVTSAWGEGTSRPGGNEGAGAPSTVGDASWSHGIWDVTTWNSAGGDFDALASASAVVEVAPGYRDFTGTALAEDVQRWLDQPTANFGWILVAESDGTTQAKRFQGRRGGLPGAPELILDYTPPLEPSGACCRTDGSCSVVLAPGSTCDGVYQGVGATCTPSPCPPPVGACCLPDALATCFEETDLGCGQRSGRWRGPGTSCEPGACPVVLEHFVDPLPLPPVARPVTGTAGAAARYRVLMRETRQKLHRDLPPTTVWGYDDGTGVRFPGPTFHAKQGEPVHVTWVNDLRDSSGALRTSHVFPVDHCVHGAPMGAPRTVVHLHGGHVASEFDGQPELSLAPGQETEYEYPNGQEAATLWYHDHALGITRLNVAMGLAGMYVVGSDEEARLALPRGEYDVPLVIQDRSFDPDGSFRYPGGVHEHVFGDSILVNGAVWPYLEVARGRYRFRVLNGAGSRTFTLALSTGSTFHQIATDGGLLEAPLVRATLTLAPGERAEIVVDFSNELPGAEIVLKNSAAAPFPGGNPDNAIFDIMKFVVKDEPGHTEPLPTALRTLMRLDVDSAVTERDFVLERHPDPSCGGAKWLINGLGWHSITERPVLGTTEVWRFINRSGVMHPMHLHLVMFQVVDRQKFKVERRADGGTSVVPDGLPRTPEGWESGWKDTVQVQPYELVRVVARFDGFTGRFPYHCHILEHEDHEMMRQFEVVESLCGDLLVSGSREACDDGNTRDGDGCSATCEIEIDAGTDAGAPDASVEGGPDASAEAGRGRARSGGSEGCGCRLAGVGDRSKPGGGESGTGCALGAFGLLAWSRRTRRRRAAPTGAVPAS